MLSDRAVLEIDGGGEYSDRTGVFVLREDLSDTEETNPVHLVGNRGQYLGELYEQATNIDPTEILPEAENTTRRAGYHLDGGAGENSWTISGTTTVDSPDEQWGDGSTDPGDPADVSRFDATGCHPLAKKDVLGQWIAQNRADSGGQARVYRGEWSDGTYADSPGVFGEPLTVAIDSVRIERDPSDSSSAEVTLEVVRTTTVPDVGELSSDLVEALGDRT